MKKLWSSDSVNAQNNCEYISFSYNYVNEYKKGLCTWLFIGRESRSWRKVKGCAHNWYCVHYVYTVVMRDVKGADVRGESFMYSCVQQKRWQPQWRVPICCWVEKTYPLCCSCQFGSDHRPCAVCARLCCALFFHILVLRILIKLFLK